MLAWKRLVFRFVVLGIRNVVNHSADNHTWEWGHTQDECLLWGLVSGGLTRSYRDSKIGFADF